MKLRSFFPIRKCRKIVQIDLAMIDAYDDVLKVLERDIEKTARRHDWHTLLLLRSIHGVGPILALVMLYEIHDINRFETVQDFASYCRLVKCSHESAGKKKGTGGAKIGNAHLKWAFSEAAVPLHAATIRRPRSWWRTWPRCMARGKRSPSWPTSWRGRSTTC